MSIISSAVVLGSNSNSYGSACIAVLAMVPSLKHDLCATS
jgi:hypothetical protein